VAGELLLNGSGGANGWPFLLLASTNLLTAEWLAVTTNQFDANGNCSLTVPVSATAPQTFYRIQLR
jgi:hypothetical protein